MRPCNIYAIGGTPCVAAYSTVRALYLGYHGPLYRVTRVSDGASTDIGVLSPGGYANAAAQTAFCAGTICTISRLYDQSRDARPDVVESEDSRRRKRIGFESQFDQEIISFRKKRCFFA